MCRGEYQRGCEEGEKSVSDTGNMQWARAERERELFKNRSDTILLEFNYK